MAAPVGDQKVIENGGIHNKEADHEAQSHEMNETIGGGVIRNHRYTLERYLNLKSMVSFGLTLQASWEGFAISFQTALLNGGPVSMVYGVIIAGFGSVALAASLAEMASIKPVVGAQYRWTAMFAPRFMSPAFWGLLQGWLTVFAWNAACALTPFLLAGLMQGLIVFNNPNYVPEGWHLTLLAWASSLLPVLLNVYARHVLAPLEIAAAILHILLFIAVVAVLSTMARRSTTEFVFETSITGLSGWSSPGIQFGLGLLCVTFPLSGFDSVLHMSDEVKNASKKIPNSMVWAVAINAITTFGFIICLLYCIGDLEAVSLTPTKLPIIEVIYQATGSKAGTNFIITMIIIIVSVSNFSIFASVSRLVWAFARDNGLPFPEFFSRVHTKLKIPLNALLLVFTISVLINLIPIGSSIAFYAVTSLSTISLYVSYVPPIALLLLRKLEGRHPTYGPWSLGKWGIPINIFALCYALYIIIFLALPPLLPVTGDTMNYASPILGAVIVIALADWFFNGKKRFDLPDKELTM